MAYGSECQKLENNKVWPVLVTALFMKCWKSVDYQLSIYGSFVFGSKDISAHRNECNFTKSHIYEAL